MSFVAATLPTSVATAPTLQIRTALIRLTVENFMVARISVGFVESLRREGGSFNVLLLIAARFDIFYDGMI